MSLGARIRQIRLEKKITQHQLARLCNFEKASMSRIESGKTNVTVITLQKICKALAVDIAEVFVGNAFAATEAAPFSPSEV
jgi:transcriptional regulator with XRE-family HTH domain